MYYIKKVHSKIGKIRKNGFAKLRRKRAGQKLHDE